MFSEILKIIPKLDPGALNQMERTLSGRFTKIAKGFGKGLVNVFKGGGLLGGAVALIDKLLNPLKETQAAIDGILKKSDDIATNATQFNTSSGRLFKLIQLAKGSGLDQETLLMMLTKFQTAVADAKANPTVSSPVRNFTGEKDTAKGFFEFIQALQKMNKNDQVRVQESVFGEKSILKMSSFLNDDFAKSIKDIGLDKVTTEKLTKSIEGMAGLNKLQDVLGAKRETGDVVTKGGLINSNMIRARDASEKLALDRENQQIKSYQDLAVLAQTVDKVMILVEQGVGMLGKLITTLTPFVQTATEAIGRWMKSPLMRGVKGLFGGKDE